MASESSATDQSIDEHAEERKVGDVTKCADGEEIIFQPKEAAGKEEADKSKEEGLTGMSSTASVPEEKYESDNNPFSDVTKKEEQHERIGEVGNSLQESEVSNSSEPPSETKEGNLQSQADDAHETPSEVQENSSDFVETSQESLISESKTKDLKDTGIKPTFENERKPEEAASVSTGVDISEDGNIEAETHEAANPESSQDKGNIELIKYEDSKDEIQVLVPTEIPTVVVPDAAEVPEKNDIDLGNPASIEVPVQDLEVESGFPEEQKSEESTEIEEPSLNVSVVDAGGEVIESSSYEVKPSEVAEVVEKKNDGLEVETIQNSVKNQDYIEVKPELAQDIDLGSPGSIDVPVKDLEVQSGFLEEQKSEESTEIEEPSSNVCVDAGGEVVESSSYEVKPSEVAEVVEKKDDGLEVETILTSVKNQDDIEVKPELAQDIDSGSPASIDVPVKDLEVQSGFLEEQKSEESTKIEEPSSNVSIVDAGGEVVESSSYEGKPSEVTKVVAKKEDGLEVEIVQTSVRNQDDDIEAKPELAQDIDSGSPANIEVPVKDLEVESGYPEEQKSEVSTKTKEPSSNVSMVDAGGDVVEFSSHEVKPSEVAEVVEKKDDSLKVKIKNEDVIEAKAELAQDIDSGNPTTIEVPVKDLETEVGFPEEHKLKESTETKEPSSNVSMVDAGGEVVESSSYEVKPSEVAEVVEKEDDGLEVETILTSVKNQDVIEAKPELVQDIDSGNPANIEVPVKNLEVESGFPEEHKSKESTETIEQSINVSTIVAGVEAVGSSSYQLNPSEVAEFVEKKDDGLGVETIQSSVKNQDDFEAKPELAQDIDSGNPANIEVPVKDPEVEAGFPEEHKSKESTETKEPSLNVSKIDAGGEVVGSSEVKPSEVAEVIEKRDDGFEVETIQSSVNNQDDIKAIEATTELAQDQFDNYDGVPRVEGDKLADKVNVAIAEAVERDSVDTVKDPAEASSDQVNAPSTNEFVNETLEVSSKELNIAPEDNEVLSKGDEKSEILKEDVATSVEAPNDITAAEESLDQVIEKKSASSISETQAPSEDKSVDKEKDVKEEDKDIHLNGSHETPSVVQSDFTEKFPSQEPTFSESKTKDLKDTEIKSTSENDRKPEEALLASTGGDISADENVEAETQEAANPEFSKGKVDIELIKSGDSKDEIPVLVSAEIPTIAVPYASEAPEKNGIDSSNLTSIEVPVKYLEVESAPPEEQKSDESSETKELISNVSTIDAGGQVIGSSSHEVKPSEIVEVVAKKDDDLEVETVQTPLKNQNDIEAKPELAQTQFDENVSKRVEVKKDDEIFEGGIKTSTAPDSISALAEVSSEEEKACEPGVMVEEEDETYLESENIDTVPKVAEVTLEGGRFLEGDKLVDKEKFVNSEAVERDLVGTFTDPIEAKVSSDKAKAPLTTDIVKEALEVRSKELSIAPEASEVPFDGDKLSEGDEKTESLNGEAATSVEAPKDITTAEESLVQVIEEKKSESSVSETTVPFEDKLVDEEKDVNEEAKEINLQSQTDDAEETPSIVQSDFAKTTTSQEPVFSESKTEDLKDIEIKPTSGNDEEPVETPLVSASVDISEDGNVVSETQEATNPESSKDKVDIEFFNPEDSKDEIQALVPDEIPAAVVPDVSETPENFDVNSSNLTNIEVTVKDLEVESGSHEEDKLKESAETKEPGSNVGIIDAGVEVVGSSSYEIMPSKVAGVVEKNDDGLEVETIKTSVKSEEDPEANPELAQYHEIVSQGVEVKKDHEIVEGGIETPIVPDDVLPLATVSSKEEKASEPGVVVEEEETTLKSDRNDGVLKVAEVSVEGGNVLEGDKLVNKENVVNAEAVERDFVDMSDQLKAPTTTEIVKEALEVTSKELNIAPEVSEAPAEVDKVSVGDEEKSDSSEVDKVYVGDEEKSDSLKVGDALSLEEPKYIIAIKESLDTLVEEKKNVDSVSETAAPADDKVVDKEKYVNAEDEEKVFVSISTDPTAAVVSSEKLRAPEIFEVSDKKALEDASKELKFAPEASEIPSEGDKLSAGEETSESLEGEAATSVEALKDNTTTEESLNQVIEKKSESSTSETQAPFEDKLVVDNEKDVNEEAKEINLQGQAVGADETPSVVQSGFVETSAFQEPVFSESKTEDLKDIEIKPTSEARNVEVETHAANPEFSNDKVCFVATGVDISEADTFSVSDEEKNESLIVGESTLVEAPKDILFGKESLDQLVEAKKSESSVKEKEAPIDDKLVIKEENMNVEDEERDLINTSTNATAAEVSSEKVKAPEIVEESNKQALEVTSKELIISPEASKVPSEKDELSAGEEKSESLKGVVATLAEAPKNITTVEESLDHVIEERRDNSVSETEALAEDRLADKGKNVNEERDLVDTSTDSTPAEVSSDQVNASKTADIMKEESNEQALDVPSEGVEVSAGDEEKRESLKGEDATLVEAPKDVTISEESPDQVIKRKMSQHSKNEVEALGEDFDMEKDLNGEAEKIDIVDTSTDPSASEVFSEQAKVTETADIIKDGDKEALEFTSKELNIVPEVSEVPSDGDKVSTEEKSESLKDEDATSLDAPKTITAAEKSIDQLIEENKTEAPTETSRDFDTSKLFPEAVKDIIASETVEEEQNETSNDLSVEEKKLKDSADKTEEVKTEGILQNATDKPEKEELGAEKAESEKSKDQDPIVSSDSGGAKLTKEVPKRESTIFSKVKRSIVKAKKAILRKSPGPKTLSSEAKYENT